MPDCSTSPLSVKIKSDATYDVGLLLPFEFCLSNAGRPSGDPLLLARFSADCGCRCCSWEDDCGGGAEVAATLLAEEEGAREEKCLGEI